VGRLAHGFADIFSRFYRGIKAKAKRQGLEAFRKVLDNQVRMMTDAQAVSVVWLARVGI
jgi:hypothetical protein